MPGIKFSDNLDMQGAQIQNLALPSTDTDAATKSYVDSVIRGLRWKDPVRAAASGNVTLATPGSAIDGVTLASGDRVLLYGQSAQSENGIYVWSGASSALVRATDADTSAEVKAGTIFPITEGTTNADKLALLTTNDPITLNTTALAFAIISSTGSTYGAGNGLQLSAGNFSILLDTNSGLTVSGTGLKIDPSIVVRKYATTIGNGSLTSITVTHNLGSTNASVALFETSSGAEWQPNVTGRATNTVTLGFASAPASGFLTVVVHI